MLPSSVSAVLGALDGMLRSYSAGFSKGTFCLGAASALGGMLGAGDLLTSPNLTDDDFFRRDSSS